MGADLQASAQDTSAPQLAQTQPRAFNIPAQPLESALLAFGQQSGRQIVSHGDLVKGLSSPGVRGMLSIEAALQQLLAGTGLTYSTSGGAVSLQRAGQGAGLPPGALQLDPVQVQGAFPVPAQAMIDNAPPPYAGGQVATGGQLGLLGNRGVMDTPFNQTSYTAQKAQDQQARTVKDVMADDPSVRSQRRVNAIGDDNVFIRGFQVSSTATAYGGLYGILPTASISAELAERVEVLKGPSAMLNGMAPNGGFIGGTVNVVPKRAPDADLTQMTASYGSIGQVGAHADVARRFGEEKEFGVRFNGLFRAGQTEVEWNSEQRGLAALGLDYRGQRLRLSADLGYQYQYVGGVIPFIGLSPGVQLPWAPDASKSPGGQPWAWQQRKDLFGVARAEFDVTDNVTAFAAFGAHDYRLTTLTTPIVTVTNFSGNATSTAPENTSSAYTYLSGEAGVRGFADTGPIRHEFSLAGSIFRQFTSSGSVTGAAFTTNIYAPNVTAIPNLATPAANLASTAALSSIGLVDTMSGANGRVQLTAGARLQQVQANNYNPLTGIQTSSYDQSAISPTVALVVKPFWENVTFYANYIQGLQQGSVVPNNFANAGEIFPPFQSTQYEAGIKIDWGKLTTTASIFQISRPSTLTNVATNTLVLSGEQRNQGLELNFFGELAEGVRVLGGVMFLNAVLTKTQGGATNGWIAPFAPGAQFNIAGEWDLPFAKGLTALGRLTYTGSQYIDTTLPRRSLPEWTRFDVGARYAFENPSAKGKLLVARFNVDNVLGANYWEGGNQVTTLFLGQPRTFRLALAADF
ncbi:MAG: TonB-dependent receptor [Reyranella sp.]|nr:MAG: TonB-dependent receptor [Reyranella sp.]